MTANVTYELQRNSKTGVIYLVRLIVSKDETLSSRNVGTFDTERELERFVEWVEETTGGRVTLLKKIVEDVEW